METHCLRVWVSQFLFHDLWLPLRNFAETVTTQQCVLVTWAMTAQGWKLLTTAKERRELFADDLRLANARPGMYACVGARLIVQPQLRRLYRRQGSPTLFCVMEQT